GRCHRARDRARAHGGAAHARHRRQGFDRRRRQGNRRRLVSFGMKVLVVDDHALIREALRGILKELKEDAAVLEASNCRLAMRLVEEHSDVGLILLDLNLPDRNGFDVLAELRERYPGISTVVLSAFNDRDTVAKALELGALGFIPKSSTREVML